MAPLLFALALILQDAPAEAAPPPDAPPANAPAADAPPADAPPADAPMATAIPRKQSAAPLPIQGGAVSAPTDDYGYVGWCYGAISSYVELYDRAMPEVTRIERAWPTPSTEENISEVYPAQREEGKRNLVLFARAMQAAEKASPRPIQDQGADAVRRGRAMWTGATSVPKAQLAQFWMSWSPPARCEETAKALETRSLLFGQALSYNAKGGTPVVAPPPVDPAPVLASGQVEAVPALAATPEPSAEAVTAAAAEPIIDVPAGAPEAVVAAETGANAAPSAIDDLLPAAEPDATQPPVEEEPAAAPAEPAPPKPAPKKPLRGLRGPQ